jgi:hypothetical protein
MKKRLQYCWAMVELFTGVLLMKTSIWTLEASKKLLLRSIPVVGNEELATAIKELCAADEQS